MIADAIGFLRDRLNKAIPRDLSGEPAEDLFVYVGTAKEDSVTFKADSVSVLLIRIEEDTTLRQADPYARISPAGARQRVEPEIHTNLYVLLVARFAADYSRSLHYLSRVIQYFQSNRVFNSENAPELDAGIAQLTLELITPSFSEQNEIWGSLRVAYQPSALYKIRLIVFSDDVARALPETKELIQTVVQMPTS